MHRQRSGAKRVVKGIEAWRDGRNLVPPPVSGRAHGPPTPMEFMIVRSSAPTGEWLPSSMSAYGPEPT
jgi:hypothetical protein